MSDFKQFMHDGQQRVEKALDQWLPSADIKPEKLHQSMRYSTLEGGKRVRPMLVYAAGYATGMPAEGLNGPACAIEMIHVYSLIHDDLPAMDDDDLRRGRATCHKAFDDATAILAGDALQALAFHVLASDPDIAKECRVPMIETLALASGSLGMAGGQAIDLESEGRQVTLDELEEMHAKKTGALIRASIRMGALGNPDIDQATLAALDTFGRCVGLAFQIKDDILDEVGDTEKLGKPQGSDRDKDKSTFISLCGLEPSIKRCEDLLEESLDALSGLDQSADFLRDLARYIIQRDH